MSLLDRCPGGPILQPLSSLAVEEDYSYLAEDLYRSLTAPQKQVWDSDSRFKLLCSGRRFGKTYLCIARLVAWAIENPGTLNWYCLLYTSPSPRDRTRSRMPSSA